MPGNFESCMWAYESLANDIFKFGEAMGFGRDEMTPDQIEMNEAIMRGERFLAVRACKGSGKSKNNGLIGTWRTFRRRRAETLIVAPGWAQVEHVIKEAELLIADGDPQFSKLFEVFEREIRIAGDRRWRMRASSPRAEQKAGTRGAGFHNPFATVIVDEASLINRAIMTTTRTTLTNPDPLMVVTGNPEIRGSAFHDIFVKEAHEWWTRAWRADRCPIIPKDLVEKARIRYGENHPIFRVHYLGEFPLESMFGTFSLEDLMECTKTDRDMLRLASPTKRFGIDLARFGLDSSVIVAVEGNAVVDDPLSGSPIVRFRKREPADVLRYAMQMQRALGWKNRECVYVVDAGGLGGGAIHVLPEANKSVFEFNFGSTKVENDDAYCDLATEAWFSLAERVRNRMAWLPDDEELFDQLTNREFSLRGGKHKLDPKALYGTKTSGHSPDEADALVMAFYPWAEAGMESFVVETDRSYKSSIKYKDKVEEDRPLSEEEEVYLQ